jgi:hypothetical protein
MRVRTLVGLTFQLSSERRLANGTRTVFQFAPLMIVNGDNAAHELVFAVRHGLSLNG